MSIVDGQRGVSLRKWVVASCQHHKVVIPAVFHESEVVYAIAIVDESVPEKPRLVGETFYNVENVLAWFRSADRCPPNYRILDFKRGCVLVWEHDMKLVRGASFDNRRDVDVQY